jgi:hypothetical protein
MVLIDLEWIIPYNTCMKNIFARHNAPKFDAPINDLKNYRFFGDEMEVLGGRLDAARNSLANGKTAWARWYWSETIDRLMLQWRALPVLHDAAAQMTQLPRWHIGYDYWEQGYENYGIDDKLFDLLFREPSLDASWNRIRDARLQRCQC